MLRGNFSIYYTNTSEIPAELLCKSMASSHVNKTCYIARLSFNKMSTVIG